MVSANARPADDADDWDLVFDQSSALPWHLISIWGVNPGTYFLANLLTRVKSRNQTWESLSGVPVGIGDPESNRRGIIFS